MPLSTTRPSIWWNMGLWVASESERNTRPGISTLMGGFWDVHGADLAAGGLGAQQELIGQVEGILHVAGGVILRARSGG